MKFSLATWRNLGLTAIVLLAVFVRFFKLGSVPIELNRDEASLGYTAYSILLTGHEEHGQFWPIQIESFGDWKLPLYVYALSPILKVFDLTAWSIRLPSALAGLSLVTASHFLVKLLLPRGKSRGWLSWLTPLLLAVSPWAVHFSHVAYEAHLSLALFVWGLIGLLSVLRAFEQRQERLFRRLLGSLGVMALTMLGYHSYQVFLPLFLLTFAWIYRAEWRRFFAGQKNWLVLSFLPFLLMLGVLMWSGARSANNTKFQALSIFNLQAYDETVKQIRMMTGDPDQPLFVLAANKGSAWFTQVQTNFFKLFSPEFLYLTGGGNHAHNITGYGNLYPLMFFGLAVGIVLIFIERKQWQVLLGSWILSAAVAPMITFAANHTTRFSPGFLPIEILSVYGWYMIIVWLNKFFSRKLAVIILSAVTIGLSYSAYQFLIYYYFIFPQRDAQYWSWQMKPLVYWIDNVKTQYDAVYVQDQSYSPYIYWLVHEPANPIQLSSRIEFYPVDGEGFHHVRRLDNIYFQPIAWGQTDLFEGKDVLVVIEEQQIPDFNRQQENAKLLTTLKHDWVPKGYEIWEFKGKSSSK